MKLSIKVCSRDKNLIFVDYTIDEKIIHSIIPVHYIDETGDLMAAVADFLRINMLTRIHY